MIVKTHDSWLSLVPRVDTPFVMPCDPFVVRLISSSGTNNDGINNAVHCQCNTRCRLQTGDQRWEIWASVVITTSSFVWLQPSSPVLATPPSSTSVAEMDKWTLSGRILHFYKAIFTGDNYCQILRARVLRCCAPLWVLLSCSNITNALNTWNQFEYQTQLTSGQAVTSFLHSSALW